MNYQKGELVYEGKAKKVFSVVDQPQLLWMEFKDSLTAFNAQKKGSFSEKGDINKEICNLIFRFLEENGVGTHRVADIDSRNSVVKKLKMIPVELVVRNRIAGSLAKKFGLEEGGEIANPLVEFYFKNDELQDPFMSEDQAVMMKAIASMAEAAELKKFGQHVNQCLRELFSQAGIDLVDFKIEVGRDAKGQLVLGDEISPDSCRLWDKKTGEKMDKDRFRRDLGKVEESYREVLKRLRDVRGSK